ncbi:putative ankyrin repeat protein FPV244 [Trichonephila clavipes]|nr:putative ankyrin repeat protein FPV244 [Trichonephila clavipes]
MNLKPKEEEIERRIKRITRYIPDLIAYRSEFSTQSSILHYATDAAMVRHILHVGADPNARIRCWDETPIMTAIKLHRPPEVIKELLLFGANVNMRSRYLKSTPLNLATDLPDCNVEIVNLLLEHGADINTLNKYYDTPLIHAIRHCTKNMDLIKTLLEAGASINGANLKGETPLITAMKNPRCTVELFRELLRYKADVNFKDKKNCTPLHYAVKCLKNNRFKIVKELIRLDCDIHAKDDSGQTPLLLAIDYIKNKMNLGFCKCLIRYAVLKTNTKYPEIYNIDQSLMYKQMLIYIWYSLKEVEFMKIHIIDDGISLYDYVLSKTVRTTVGDKLLEAIDKSFYPIYNDLILKKAKRAALLNILSEQKIYTYVSQGNTKRKITLDADSIIDVCKHLKIYELENLVDAYGWVFKEINGPSSRQLKRSAEEIQDATSKYCESDPIDDETDEDENNESSKDPSNADAFSALETAMEWYKQQPKCFPTQLLPLKRIRDLASRKRRCTMVQQKTSDYFFHNKGKFVTFCTYFAFSSSTFPAC